MATAVRSIGTYREHYLPGTDAQPGGGLVKVTFCGASTLLFDDGSTQILIDAFITRPTMETLLVSLNNGKALIQTDPPWCWPGCRRMASASGSCRVTRA